MDPVYILLGNSILSPHLKTETDAVSETSSFPVSRLPDDGKKCKNPVILSAIHHRQNPFKSTNYLTYYIELSPTGKPPIAQLLKKAAAFE
jgi:hypothetical protein